MQYSVVQLYYFDSTGHLKKKTIKKKKKTLSCFLSTSGQALHHALYKKNPTIIKTPQTILIIINCDKNN